MRDSYHHGSLRDALVEAALGAVEEAGADALSMRDLARRAGVSSGAPYRHFADKTALLAAVATLGFIRFDARLGATAEQNAGRDLDAVDRVSSLGVTYVRFAAEHPHLFRLMFGPSAPPPGTDQALDAARIAARDHLPRALGKLQAEGLAADASLAELTELAWALVHGVASLHLDGLIPGDPAAAERLAQRVTSRLGALLRG